MLEPHNPSTTSYDNITTVHHIPESVLLDFVAAALGLDPDDPTPLGLVLRECLDATAMLDAQALGLSPEASVLLLQELAKTHLAWQRIPESLLLTFIGSILTRDTSEPGSLVAAFNLSCVAWLDELNP